MQNSNKIQIVSYNHQWPNIFKQEAKKITNSLGNYLTAIYHIGSTSIPDMIAKPIIDILLEYNNVDEINIIAQKLKLLNYDLMHRQIIPHVSYFTRRQEMDISFHLHLHERGSPQIKRHVNFRDYLKEYSIDARRYGELKKTLADQYCHDMQKYVMGKQQFVQEIDRKAKCWSNRKNNYAAPNTGHHAKNWSQEKLMKAMVANLNVHMTHFPQYFEQVNLTRIPGYTLVNTSLPDPTFNYVIDADFTPQDADAKLTEAANNFLKDNTPFSWWISPYEHPLGLDTILQHHHYHNTKNNIGMYFNLDTWDEKILNIPELEIIQAKDRKTLQDYALVLVNNASAFKTYFAWIAAILTEDDPIEYYVGYVDGKPVVRGSSCYFGQVAGLYGLATIPDQRKKGYATAMQQFRLKRAKKLGYHLVVLQASNEGYPLYRKLGYIKCGMFREYKLERGSC